MGMTYVSIQKKLPNFQYARFPILTVHHWTVLSCAVALQLEF